MIRKFAAALMITLSLGVTATGIAAADTPGMTHNSIPFMTYN